MGTAMRNATLRRLRLASQIFFFALFAFLLIRTEFPGSIRSAALDVRIPWPVGWFLEADPLVALATALATGTLYRNLLWALPFLLLAILVGRAFCGWICPLGSLHHFLSSLKSDAKRGAKLLESNRYKRWQAVKYHLLAAVLLTAVFGSVAGLLLDPLSFMVRSMSVAVLPAFNAAIRAGIDTAYGWPLGPVKAVVNGAGLVLNATILSFKGRSSSAACSSSCWCSTPGSRASGAARSAPSAGCSASVRGGRSHSSASTRTSATTAGDASCIARGVTIRSPGPRGARRSATCA
jgi:hypothetical protein